MSSSSPSEVVDILAAAAGSQSQASIFDMDIDLDAPILPRTSSLLFSENLYTRVIVDTRPPQIQYTCQQPHCLYITPPAPLDNKYASNLWKHYDHVHPSKAAAARKRKHASQEPLQPKSLFFEKRTRQETTEITLRGALVNLVVLQNLPLSSVDSEAFHNFIAVASPSSPIPSARTLARGIEKRFAAEREELCLELHAHMAGGSRFSITTGGWGATNQRDYAAVMIHWIDLGSEKQISKLLDMIHLEEPVHSGEYLARKLLHVTDAFGITGSVFTITCGNAKPNDSMLACFESENDNVHFTSLQPWGFTRKE